eukprot:Pgem_evm2s10637
MEDRDSNFGNSFKVLAETFTDINKEESHGAHCSAQYIIAGGVCGSIGITAAAGIPLVITAGKAATAALPLILPLAGLGGVLGSTVSFFQFAEKNRHSHSQVLQMLTYNAENYVIFRATVDSGYKVAQCAHVSFPIHPKKGGEGDGLNYNFRKGMSTKSGDEIQE